MYALFNFDSLNFKSVLIKFSVGFISLYNEIYFEKYSNICDYLLDKLRSKQNFSEKVHIYKLKFILSHRVRLWISKTCRETIKNENNQRK